MANYKKKTQNQNKTQKTPKPKKRGFLLSLCTPNCICFICMDTNQSGQGKRTTVCTVIHTVRQLDCCCVKE